MSFDSDVTPYTYKQFVNLGVNVNMRDPSLTIHVRSRPGTGKSTAVETIARAVSKVSGEPTLFVTNIMPGHSDETFGGYQFIDQVTSGDASEALARFTRPTTLPHASELKQLGRCATYKVYVDGKLSDGVDEMPERAIILLDDHSHAGVDVKKLAANLKLEGVINGFRVPPKTTVISTGNRAHDKSGTTKELAFETNRQFTVVFDVSVHEWASWAMKHSVPTELVGYALWMNGECFVKEVPADPSEPFCTPRSMALAARMLRIHPGCWETVPDGSEKRLTGSDETRRILAGYLGVGRMQEVIGYLRVAGSCPTMAQIINDPETATLPSIQSYEALYAVSQQVIAYITHSEKKKLRPQIRNIAAYIARLPAEMRDTTFRSVAYAHNGLIMSTPTFNEWQGDNMDLIKETA